MHVSILTWGFAFTLCWIVECWCDYSHIATVSSDCWICNVYILHILQRILLLTSFIYFFYHIFCFWPRFQTWGTVTHYEDLILYNLYDNIYLITALHVSLGSTENQSQCSQIPLNKLLTRTNFIDIKSKLLAFKISPRISTHLRNIAHGCLHLSPASFNFIDGFYRGTQKLNNGSIKKVLVKPHWQFEFELDPLGK